MFPLNAVLASVDPLANLPWFAWIAIFGIVFGCVSGTISAYFTHRERMTMIRMGIHPDSKQNPAPDVEKEYHPEDAEL